MNFRFRHIKLQFLLQIGFFVLYSLAAACIFCITFQCIEKHRNAEVRLKNMRYKLVCSYSDYCNFLTSADHDQQFFVTGNSTYSKQFYETLESLNDTLNFSLNDRVFKSASLKQGVLDSLFRAIEIYKNNFRFIALSIQEKGMKDYGDLQSLHEISENLTQQLELSKKPESILFALKLKSLESDFIYNDEGAYNLLLSMLDDLTLNSGLESNINSDQADLSAVISNYRSKINHLNDLMKHLGSESSGTGLVSEFGHAYIKVISSYDKYESAILGATHNYILLLIFIGSFAFVLITILYIYLIWNLLNKIRTPLLQTTEYGYLLSKGKLPPKDLPVEVQFEFSELNKSLNRIKTSIKDKQVFIESLLKQRFEIDLSLQGKNDAFGKTLLALKENMRKARDEQQKYSEEFKLRVTAVARTGTNIETTENFNAVSNRSGQLGIA